MNASQLTTIREAKRILEDCSCFRGPTGPTGPAGSNGSTIVGPIGPVGPAGTLSSFSVNGASTNSLVYWDGTSVSGISSLFYYSSINILQANLDIIPCLTNERNLGSSNIFWNNIYANKYNGIESYNYISTSGLTSSITGLGNIYLSTNIVPSTIIGLGSFGYISSSQLQSTVKGLGNIYLSTNIVPSTIIGLGNIGYISSSQLISSIAGLQYIEQPYLTSTIVGLGIFGYISSTQLQSTVKGLGNIYLSSFNTSFPSTVTGLGTAGYISSSQLESTVKGLGNVYLSSITSPANSFGRILRVDSIYGNDVAASNSLYTLPFSTISSAMTLANSGDTVYILPGKYNEPVEIKNGVAVRGINSLAVAIQQLNVTKDTTLVKMNSNTRLEDITLNLTSVSPLATNLIGVNFSSCQTFAKIRTAVINVNNSGLTANGTPINIYGIYSTGHSSTLQYSAADDIERVTINVVGNGLGNKRCVYSDDSNRLQLRNCSLMCSDTMNATFPGGSYIGIETNNVNSILQLKNSSVCGCNYTNSGTNSADVSQTAGLISIGNSDLINRNANNHGVTITSAQTLYSMGVAGSLSNGPGQAAPTWANSYLVPGTISFTGGAALPISNYYPIRTPVVALLTSFTFQAATGPGYPATGHSNLSSFATLARNGIILPQFTLSLVGNQTVNYLSTSTIRLGANDTFGIYLSTSDVNTAMTYPIVNLSLF